MSILSFLLGLAAGIIIMIIGVGAASTIVILRFKRHPELIGKLIAKNAVRPTLRKIS